MCFRVAFVWSWFSTLHQKNDQQKKQILSWPLPIMAGQPTPPPNVLPGPRNRGLIAGPIKGKPMVNKAAFKPLFLRGGTLGGGRFTSHIITAIGAHFVCILGNICVFIYVYYNTYVTTDEITCWRKCHPQMWVVPYRLRRFPEPFQFQSSSQLLTTTLFIH